MKIIATCIETVKEQFPNVAGIWLFGSNADNTATSTSDIDLAILGQEKIAPLSLWQCAQQMAAQTNKEIDLLEASTVLRAQIMKEGKLIYCCDKYLCDRFETEAFADYLRFAEERKDLLSDIQSRGSVLNNG